MLPYVFLCLLVVVVKVVAEEVVVVVNATTPPQTDPIPGLFVRQESAIRKLDGLTAKISKLDDLEIKIDLLTAMLQEREVSLEVLLESLSSKVAEVTGKVEEMQDKLVTVDEKVEGVGNKMDVLTRVVGDVDGKVETIGDQVEEMDRRIMEMEETWTEMNQTLQNQKEMMEMSATTTTTVNSSPLLQITSLLHNLTGRMAKGLEESRTRVTQTVASLIQPAINITNHLAGTVINRIRVSNLAMDRRLGAVLHALSHRHSLLQETLGSSMASLNTHITTELQELVGKVENKLQEVEDVVMDVVTTSTTTPSSSSSSSATTVTPSQDPLQDNQEVLQVLDSILHLSNLTLHRLLEKEEQEEEEEEEKREEKEKVSVCLLVDPDTTTFTTALTNTTATKLQETVRAALQERLGQVEEQLSGLRIYLSTSLHLHANQVEDRMAGVEAGLLRAVQETINKSNRGLDKLRRASLGYLDAAVTSISSAAVASAQYTADHLTEAMKGMSLSLTRRLSQVEVAVMAAAAGGSGRNSDGGNTDGDIDWQKWWWWWWCLAATTGNNKGSGRGGSGSCISALPGNASSWTSSRSRCREVGGDLLIALPSDSSLRTLSHAIHPTGGPPTPSYWLGGQRVRGEWRWVTGAHVEGEVGEGREGTTEDCLAVLMSENGRVKLAAFPCHTPLPALCQLPAPPMDASGPPLDPESNEVTPIGKVATRRFLTPEDLNLT